MQILFRQSDVRYLNRDVTHCTWEEMREGCVRVIGSRILNSYRAANADHKKQKTIRHVESGCPLLLLLLLYSEFSTSFHILPSTFVPLDVWFKRDYQEKARRFPFLILPIPASKVSICRRHAYHAIPYGS